MTSLADATTLNQSRRLFFLRYFLVRYFRYLLEKSMLALTTIWFLAPSTATADPRLLTFPSTLMRSLRNWVCVGVVEPGLDHGGQVAHLRAEGEVDGFGDLHGGLLVDEVEGHHAVHDLIDRADVVCELLHQWVERSGSGDLVEHGRAPSRQASGVSSAQALEQFGSPASAHILVLVREVAVEFFVALVELVHGFFESTSRHQLDII